MATTSTYAAVKAALVSLWGTALQSAGTGGGAIPVDYAWPGADAAAEAVYLGRHPEFVGDPLSATGTIRGELASIKAGRKYRNETFDVEATVWSFRPDKKAADAAVAEARAFVILGLLEDVLANDPKLGLTSIVKAELSDIGVALVPFERGWASVLIPSVSVQARLT